MVFVREQSRTRVMLCEFICLDVVILIEDYLIPSVTNHFNSDALRRAKLQCGFAEYIEMEIGPPEVIDKMFLDACSSGYNLGDICSLLAAGARNLKAGLTAAILSNRTTWVARILISLNAIGTAHEFPDTMYNLIYDNDIIDYIVNHPNLGHLLSMIGPIKHPEYILRALQTCVKNESIEMIEILISKLHTDTRQTTLTDVLMFAIEDNKPRIIEYAIDSGADAHVLLSAMRTLNHKHPMLAEVERIVGARALKRRRITHSSF